MKLYKIRSWDDLYENNRSRLLKTLDWLPIPNTQDGEGYTLTLSQADGAALMGAWMLILQLASKCEERGTLVRKTGKPHDVESISRLTRLSHKIVSRALDWFASEDMQWMEVVEHDDHGTKASVGGTQVPDGDEKNVTSRSAHRREGNRIEQKETEGAAAPCGAVAVIPKNLDTPEFRKTWSLWLEDRKRRRHPVTVIAMDLQLAELSKYGAAGAIASIEQSITKGWTGLFEPKIVPKKSDAATSSLPVILSEEEQNRNHPMLQQEAA